MPETAVVEMVPVYYANRKAGRGRADAFISREQAREFKELGLGDWANKKCACFVLNRKESELPHTQPSCSMGPRIIQANAEGKAWAAALLEGWAYQYAA